MLATACKTFPLAEMEGIIPRAQNVFRVMCYLLFEGQQSLMIHLIPTKITESGSTTTSKNSRNFYMQQCNEQEKDGLEVNWTQ